MWEETPIYNGLMILDVFNNDWQPWWSLIVHPFCQLCMEEMGRWLLMIWREVQIRTPLSGSSDVYCHMIGSEIFSHHVIKMIKAWCHMSIYGYLITRSMQQSHVNGFVVQVFSSETYSKHSYSHMTLLINQQMWLVHFTVVPHNNEICDIFFCELPNQDTIYFKCVCVLYTSFSPTGFSDRVMEGQGRIALIKRFTRKSFHHFQIIHIANP